MGCREWAEIIGTASSKARGERQERMLHVPQSTSTWMSMRSSSSPLMRFWYRAMLPAEQVHSRVGSPSWSHRHPCE